MRLNGALRPHGAPYIGRSIGAKNYRDKRPQQQEPVYKYKYKFNSHNNTVTASDQSISYNNNKENITTLSAVKAATHAATNNLKRTPGYYPLTDVLASDVYIKATCKSSGTPPSPSPSQSSPPPAEPVANNMAPFSGRTSGEWGEAAATGHGSDEVRTQSMEEDGVECETRHRRRGRLMRVPQSLVAGLSSFSMLVLCLVSVLALLPSHVICDDDNSFFVNSFSMGLETTTPEFDYASRGQKKFGDKCENTLECGFPRSICDPKKKSCQCVEDYPVTNHIDKCGKEAAVNESCFFNEQCESSNFQTECRDGRCVCRFEMTPFVGKDGIECRAGNKDKRGPETYIDPAMIGVLVGMALMFVIICVVLRLFSQARWRENRTIFNTPNPRLMNVSLLRDSKLLHGQERRGSRMSVRAPSRQPSMASLRPHSPNPSLGKTGSRSASGSNASATSVRSTRSNSVAPGAMNNDRKSSVPHHHHHHQQPQQQPLITNITSNPVAESVTVEIIEPEK